jgi:malonyl-CoA O-methyltransferase
MMNLDSQTDRQVNKQMSKQSSLQTVDKKKVAHAFSQAATTYDAHAFLQKEVARRLLQRVELKQHQASQHASYCILDAGCGTGLTTRQLLSSFPSAQVIGVDIAEGMIEYAKSVTDNKSISYQLADIEQLPFGDNQFDLIFSSLTIQWLPELEKTFSEIKRVLKPGGYCFFSTLGPETLFELDESCKNIVSATPVNQFVDSEQVKAQLSPVRFNEVVIEKDTITLEYKQLIDLMRELKAIGSHRIESDASFKSKGLFGKNKFEKISQAYEKYRKPNGYLPATYQVIYGAVRKEKK